MTIYIEYIVKQASLGLEEHFVQVNQTAFMSNGQPIVKTDYVMNGEK